MQTVSPGLKPTRPWQKSEMKTKSPPVTLDLLPDQLRAVRGAGKQTWDLQRKQGDAWAFVSNHPDIPSLLSAVVRRRPDVLFPVGQSELTVSQVLQRFDETLLSMCTVMDHVRK